MLKMDEESKSCKIVFDQDSESNKVNIMWMIPQYAIITIGEVLNSATGNEFVYTQVSFTIRCYILLPNSFQAPASMKSVLGSFWFLTTCIGNILVVFFVEIKLWPTQVF